MLLPSMCPSYPRTCFASRRQVRRYGWSPAREAIRPDLKLVMCPASAPRTLTQNLAREGASAGTIDRADYLTLSTVSRNSASFVSSFAKSPARLSV